MDSLTAASGNVARTVRAHRDARGWSLGALAKQTGLSKALLSKIEAGNGNPSLETMWRLARAFDIALGALLGEDRPPQVRLIRAQDGPSFTSEGGLATRLVLADGRNHRTEVFEATLEAGVAYESLHSPGTEELVYCISGALEVGPAGHEEELSPGDALWFPGDVTHRYVSSSGARILSIMTYPPAQYGRSPVPT